MGLLENVTEFNKSNFTDVIMEGKVIEATFGTYYNLMGMWFFTLFFCFTFGMVYIKTRSMPMTSIVMLFMIAVASPFMAASMMGVMFILIAITLAILIITIVLDIRG